MFGILDNGQPFFWRRQSRRQWRRHGFCGQRRVGSWRYIHIYVCMYSGAEADGNDDVGSGILNIILEILIVYLCLCLSARK